MKKYLKIRNSVLFTITVFLLLSMAGVSIAQIKNTSFNTTPLFTTTKIDINTTDSATVDLNSELNRIEESTEKILDELDTINNNSTSNTKNNTTVTKTKTRILIDTEQQKTEDFRHQSEELIRILREQNAKKIEELKRKKLEDARSAIKAIENEENDVISDNVNDLKEESVLDNEIVEDLIGSGEVPVEIESLDEIEKDVAREIERLDRIVFDKKRKIIERVKTKNAAEEALLDSDEDGISDFDELNIYETDPYVADSDGDGYVDGAEILSGFDPNSPSIESIIKYEDPREVGESDDSLFAVSSIEIDNTDINNNEEDSKNILIKGKSIPNAFITLYIYSNPTIVTVKTDKDGNWEYTLDKELENGDHEIYVAITDNTGSIVSKSNPIPFVKQAAAVTVDESLLSLDITDNKIGFFNGVYLYITILSVVFLTGIVLVIVGIRARATEIGSGQD